MLGNAVRAHVASVAYQAHRSETVLTKKVFEPAEQHALARHVSSAAGTSWVTQPRPASHQSATGAPQQRPSGAPSRPFPGSAPRRPPGSFQRTPYQRPAGGSRPSNPRNDRWLPGWCTVCTPAVCSSYGAVRTAWLADLLPCMAFPARGRMRLPCLFRQSACSLQLLFALAT